MCWISCEIWTQLIDLTSTRMQNHRFQISLGIKEISTNRILGGEIFCEHPCLPYPKERKIMVHISHFQKGLTSGEEKIPMIEGFQWEHIFPTGWLCAGLRWLFRDPNSAFRHVCLISLEIACAAILQIAEDQGWAHFQREFKNGGCMFRLSWCYASSIKFCAFSFLFLFSKLDQFGHYPRHFCMISDLY